MRIISFDLLYFPDGPTYTFNSSNSSLANFDPSRLQNHLRNTLIVMISRNQIGYLNENFILGVVVNEFMMSGCTLTDDDLVGLESVSYEIARDLAA